MLRIIARLNVGGPARHVVLLDRGLQAKGYETLLVHGSVAPGEASLDHIARGSRLPVRTIPELGPRLRIFDDIRALIALLRIVFGESPDIIHTHTAKAGALGRVCAFLFNATRRRASRAAVVHTFHGHVFEGYFGPAANAVVRSAERVLAATTDRIVAISERQRRDLVDRFRIAPADRVTVVELGLELEPLLRSRPAVPKPPGDSGGAGVAGYVGRFVPVKNLKMLVDAFADALPDVPGARLILAGDGPLRGALEAQVRERRIEAQVSFLGWTEDLVSLYSALDVCILASLNEGTPVAAIEAMAAGKLVIGTAVGGVPDLIDDGRTGILVPPGETRPLARAIVAALSDAARARSIGEAARVEVARRFSADRLVHDIDALYRGVLADKRGTIADRS